MSKISTAMSHWLRDTQIAVSERQVLLDEIRGLGIRLDDDLDTLSKLEATKLADRLAHMLEGIQSPDAKIILEEAFTGQLEFGTAGLRARMGAGLNRMNRHTLAIAAEALGHYLKSSFSSEAIAKRPVILGHDARHNSRDFAETVAAQLSAQGVQVRLFPSYTATPLLAYAIRPLNGLCGVMITASHNAGEYNGMKLYAEDGIQSSSSSAAMIADEMTQIMAGKFITADYGEELPAGRILDVDPSIETSYFDAIRAELPITGHESALRIAYTPVHGVGAKFIVPLFETLGYEDLHIVEAERDPDPDFTGIPRPNPEYEETLERLRQLAETEHCDIAIATDPDADRLALMLPQEDGQFRMMNGNETAALLIDYYAQHLRDCAEMPERPVLVKSIVSDFFAAEVAELYDIELCESLTGFKNICGKRRLFEKDEQPKREYIMGFEESIGFALGDSVRDKDGLRTACYALRAALKMKREGKTLYDRYLELSEHLGYHLANPIQIEREGLEGKAYIEAKMRQFREEQIESIAGIELSSREDYLSLNCEEFARIDGKLQVCGRSKIDEISQNALRFFYGDEIFFALRPSGTEPKIKFYLYTKAESVAAAEALMDALITAIREILEA
ncbi:MAG: phospho-sugar mutase [Eubacteriales bacterium]|nr:phospho-sugar mutase [Eubacteriales bacterium]